MQEEEILEQKKLWYSDKRVLFECVKDMKAKETAFINVNGKNTVRNIKAHAIDFLKINMESFQFHKRFYNMYVSQANFNNLPIFSFNPKIRRDQMDDFNLRKNFIKYLTDYDFFIDLDPKGSKQHTPENLLQLKTVKKLLDKYNVRYWVQFTGKGFHIIIEAKEFNWLKPKEKPAFYKKIADRIKYLHALNVDDVYTTSEVWRRVRKVRYSFDCKTGNICWPLFPSEIENFNLEIVKPQNCINRVYKRGIYIFNQTKTSNLYQFCQDILAD